MRMRTLVLLPLLLAPLACGKKEAPQPPPPAPMPAPAPVVFAVSSVTLGKALGSDKKIVEATSTFGVKDTIYASVETVGTADKARLEAKWTFTGSKGPVSVNDNSMELVNLAGPSVNEFHITKKTDWPKGAYQVEILLNGASAMKKDFTVQ
ncbi:MAG: hypothetical protein BWY56_00215 [Acidobacteria bacterium ADurb.Bin340]|nr:MAG: hypothetical protein BWY56_00215 [Acidobacteria bacterium ADurb.Bin340]HOD34180.1 hypothetical protein [Holophaga sp.]HQL47997.1 hypothetical protein [Holophaga sp.]